MSEDTTETRAQAMLADFHGADVTDARPDLEHVDGNYAYALRGTGIVEIDVDEDSLTYVPAHQILDVRTIGSSLYVDTTSTRIQLLLGFETAEDARAFAGRLQRRLFRS